ncbi:DeoR/GlpR family DNA-binding transcription regulator [Agrobacterium pusense]|uniref:Transcriptional regulator DeoR family protein n=1 Tax=Agrobacterium pusense TaxID=648995 RepID=U4Q811_9HYPH|nr:DeoR/GlpR family DNA-binding transcription regulator [Agrobacterium pusense]CDI12202.1 Transcriptional regulator DeoR family protein [Agrobacterium pusense]
MHERQRHQIIISALRDRSVLTVQHIIDLTDASEATARRDIAALERRGSLKRVRGGAVGQPHTQLEHLSANKFEVSSKINDDKKRAIARRAVDMCDEGDAVIINGGTTTYQMVHYMSARRLQVMTNSFAVAEHLVKQSKCTVTLPGGHIYREQSLILSPFENDASRNFYARRMFVGAEGIGPLGVMESDYLIVQSQHRLMQQAEEVVILADSSKFQSRSSLILCSLEAITTIITDDDLADTAREMITIAGVQLITVKSSGQT